MRFVHFFAFLALLPLAYCGSVFLENAARTTIQPDLRPVGFVSEETILVQSSRDLSLWDLPDGAPKVLFELPEHHDGYEGKITLSSGSCFIKDRWVLHTNETTGTGLSSRGPVFEIFIQEGQDVAEAKVSDFSFSSRWNTFDCELISEPDSPPLKIMNPRKGHRDLVASASPHLFSRKHAQDVRVASALGTLVIEYRSREKEHRHELHGSWSSSRPHVVHENNTSVYWVWDNRGRIDAGAPRGWPWDMWRLDLNSGTTEKIEIPAGPWVADYEERFQCFSCGCGCYRKVRFIPAGDTLFAHVTGIGFPSHVQGIYALSYGETGADWMRLVEGAKAGPPILSPSGCKMVYTSPEITVKDICD